MILISLLTICWGVNLLIKSGSTCYLLEKNLKELQSFHGMLNTNEIEAFT